VFEADLQIQSEKDAREKSEKMKKDPEWQRDEIEWN
jgi:hypothetical protein